MHFGTKSYLKSNRYHIAKHAPSLVINTWKTIIRKNPTPPPIRQPELHQPPKFHIYQQNYLQINFWI